MEDIRQLIERRIINFEILSLDYLTPLLQEQIRHAIALHREALKHPNVTPYLQDLDDLHDQLKEHWSKVHGGLVSRAFLLQDIIMFRQFLIAKLLEDYTNMPYSVGKWALDQAKRIEQKSSTGAKDGSNYQVHVVYPLEEMMLDRDHVENKLRVAAAGRGDSGSDIQLLIDRCNWSNLATALTNDRNLALRLFERQPIDTDIFDANTDKSILQGIDEIKGKYFAELSDSSTFVISTHAKKMSAGQASNHTDHGSPLTSLTITPPNITQCSKDPFPGNGFTWNIYNTIASSLGGTKPNAMSRAYSTSSDANEPNSLIKLKKAD